MTKERFIEALGNGFNAKVLAEKIHTSEGHVNELRRKPNPQALANAFNVEVAKVEEELKKPNLEALWDFLNAKEDVSLTEEDLVAITTKPTREKASPKIYVGLETPLGKIIQIQKIGKTMAYCVMKDGKLDVYGTKDIENSLNPTSEESVEE